MRVALPARAGVRFWAILGVVAIASSTTLLVLASRARSVMDRRRREVLEAVIDALSRRADEVATLVRDRPDLLDDALARDFMADFQSAKLQVNRLSEAVVDRALSLAGGGGYTSANPLARLVRDVRAGQFMQPFSPHEALGFVGAVAAGTEPDVEA